MDQDMESGLVMPVWSQRRPKKTYSDPLANLSESDRAFIQKGDVEDNDRSSPPPGEHIELHSIWVAECYPPSLIQRLIDDVRQLGWGQPRPGGHPVDSWIEDQRGLPRSGAWLRLSVVGRREEQARWGSMAFVATLPTDVDYVTAEIHYLIPGIFVLVTQFILGPAPSQLITDTLRRRFHTYAEPYDRGISFINPISQKRDALKQLRRELRLTCTSWLGKHLPGAFALTNRVDAYPTCEFITLDSGLPIDPDNQRTWDDYISVLGLGHEFESWTSAEYPGLYLQRQRFDPSGELALILAANRNQAFADDQLKAYGGRTRDGLTNRLSDFGGPMTRWALHALLFSYERHYAMIRDNAGLAAAQSDIRKATGSISVLETALLRLSGDAVAVVPQLAQFCDDKRFFHRGVAQFFSLHPMRPTPKPADAGFPIRMVRKALKKTRPDPAQASDEDLFELLREGLVHRSHLLRETQSGVHQVVQSVSDLLNTRSQQALAKSNVRLQWMLVVFTVVLLIMGGIQVYLAWLVYGATR